MFSYDPEPKFSSINIDSNQFCLDEKTTPTVFYRESNILVLDNVLNESECSIIRDIIDNPSEKIIKKIYQNQDNTRNKICVNFKNLSGLVLSRCDEYIPKSVYKYCRIIDNSNNSSTNKMYWEFNGFNDNWRLVKCNIGSSLSMHFDGAHIKSVDEKSIYTVMLYLNESDGDIRFRNGMSFLPKLGRMIIFDQSLEHEGLINHKETKYFVRTELMYTREIKVETENDKRGFEKYQEAKNYINIDNEKSLMLETDAFKLSPLLESLIFE